MEGEAQEHYCIMEGSFAPFKVGILGFPVGRWSHLPWAAWFEHPVERYRAASCFVSHSPLRLELFFSLLGLASCLFAEGRECWLTLLIVLFCLKINKLFFGRFSPEPPYAPGP